MIKIRFELIRERCAARLVDDHPEIQEKVVTGELSLSAISQAQGFFNQERKQNGTPVPKERKAEILESLIGSTTRENLRLLCQGCNKRNGILTFGLDKMTAVKER